METRTAGGVVVQALVAEGVDHVYGLPGGHVLSIYDALYDEPRIRHVLVRHEHTAASMAAAHAQLTGRPGVCCVTAGPGATNLLTGVAEAFVGCLPMVIIAGRGSTATAHRGASQEVATERIFAPVTKWSIRVDRAEALGEILHQAFRIAANGRPGPVLIDIPRDVLDTEIPAVAYHPAGPRSRPAAERDEIARATAALSTARRPLLVAGGGCIAAGVGRRLQTLAEQLRCPVLTSLAGRGSIDEDHPLAAGGLGAHRTRLSKRLLAEADVVLGLGTRFEEMETNWTPSALPAVGSTYIQVDIDPSEIGRSLPADIGIVGDAAVVVEQLLDGLKARGPSAAEWDPAQFAVELEELVAEAADAASGLSRPMSPLAPIESVRRALPRDATIAIDVGCLAQHIAGAMPYTRVHEPRTTIVPSSFYGMGFAASALPAARVLRPDHPAVCFVGDGSFQMALAALPVAAEHRLGVTWCVLDDGAFGSIRDIQQYRFAERILDTEFSFQPDFVALARACGCHAELVEDPDELDGAVQRALDANEDGIPAVLSIPVRRDRLRGTLEHYAFYPTELVDPVA